MASLADVFKDKERTNWLKAWLAIDITKSGLENLADNEAQKFHNDIYSKFRSTCNSCSTSKLRNKKPCPRKICDEACLEIIKEHRYNTKKDCWSWQNTSAHLWQTNYWEIAKCYFPPDGYAATSSIKDTDFNGVISFMLNCTRFDNKFSFPITTGKSTHSAPCLLYKAREIVKAVRHSSIMKVTDVHLQDYFTTFTNLLSDSRYLSKDSDAQNAVMKLAQLEKDTLLLTTAEMMCFLDAVDTTLKKHLKDVAKDVVDESVNDLGINTILCINDIKVSLDKCKKELAEQTVLHKQDIKKQTDAGKQEIKVQTDTGKQEIKIQTDAGKQEIKVQTDTGKQEIKVQTNTGKQEIKVQTDTGKQEIKVHTDTGKQEIKVHTDTGKQEIKVHTDTGKQEIKVQTDTGKQEIKVQTNTGKQEIKVQTNTGKQEIKVQTDTGKQEIKVHTDTGKQEIKVQTDTGKQDIKEQTDTGKQDIKEQTDTCKQEIKELTVTCKQNFDEHANKRIRDINEQFGNTNFTETSYTQSCEDLLGRLVDHYRDNVSNVPLSTLAPSLDKHIQDIYATPKIYKMKIENDGRRTKQEQISTYKDCFYKGDHLSRRTYLQGEPGSGKTTFAANLVNEWCNVHAPATQSIKEQSAFGYVDTLHKFKFLFFIALRDSREHTYVMQMIKSQLIHKIYAEEEWEIADKLVLQIMKNVMHLVIQDGLDEWPGEEALPSMAGISKDQCIVLTTSRPWKLADERIKNSQIDILLEVDGISNPNAVNEMILRCLLDDSKDIKESVAQFEKFLTSRNLWSIRSSPMLHTLVLCTWVTDIAEDIGSSLCGLYTTMLENLCKKANQQISYFDLDTPSPVSCFSRTKYIKPNMRHIDAIAKVAFSFLFSNDIEKSLVFSDLDLSAHLSENAKHFALDSGILSKRKGKQCYDNTSSFVHKTIQEFLAALHISSNTDVIDNVISEYLKRHKNSYLDMSQFFIFLCGFKISAANKLSVLMNDLDVNRDNHYHFQKCILSGYKEAVTNKKTSIDLHLSHFSFNNYGDAKDLIYIWELNTSRARSLCVTCLDVYVTIRSEGASSSLCQAPGAVSLSARDYSGPSTRDDQTEVRSSASCMEFDLSSCNSLERLVLSTLPGHNNNISVLPNALLGLKKLKYLEILAGCKCEALDLSSCHSLERLVLGGNFGRNDYITVLPNALLGLKKLKYLEIWCLLNGADPLQSAGYTPVLSSVEYIRLDDVTCSSTWLHSLCSTLLTLDHRVECELWHCNITSSDHEVKSLGDSHSIRPYSITTDLNNTCTIDAASDDCPGLWETLLDQNINHLSLQKISWNVNNVSSMSRSLASLSQLETLTMHLHKYIDLQLPPSLKHLTVYYTTLSPSELRHLVNKLSARTQSVECRLGFGCGNRIENNTIANIPPEEYIPIKQELEARELVEVKRFRIYDRTPNTKPWSDDAWSVRDSFGDDDYGDDTADDELCNRNEIPYTNLLSRISMRLNINCV